MVIVIMMTIFMTTFFSYSSHRADWGSMLDSTNHQSVVTTPIVKLCDPER